MAAKWPLASIGKAHGAFVHSRRVRMIAHHFAALLPPNHAVLDVGCGDGQVASLLVAARPDAHVSGVDVLVRAETRIPVTEFDGHHLPFADKSFDTVLFSDVLHHTESPGELLAEAQRVARHCVLIKDHVVTGFLARPTLRFMDWVGNAPHQVALPYNYQTQAQWDALFEECGLRQRALLRRLGLYPAWADPLFGRSLHFIGLYDVTRQ